MTVYVVTSNSWNDIGSVYTSVAGVFSSSKLAKDFVGDRPTETGSPPYYGEWYETEEMQIDVPEEDI